MKIVIDWYRHGLSCANVLHQRTLTGPLRQAFFQDPDLTGLGWRQALKTGQCLGSERKIYDFVGASLLSRAIETAMGIFEGTPTTINILPYISEHRHLGGLDKQNAPLSHRLLLETRMKGWARDHKVKGVKLDFSRVTRMVQEPDADAFYTRVLPSILKDLQRAKPKQKTFYLALVSHGAFMRTNLHLRPLLATTPKAGKPLFCQGSKSKGSKCCQEDDGEDARTFVDPAVAEPDSYSVPNTAGWRESLVMVSKDRRLDRVKVQSYYAPNPRYRVFRTGRSDPLYREDLEGCHPKVVDALIPPSK